MNRFYNSSRPYLKFVSFYNFILFYSISLSYLVKSVLLKTPKGTWNNRTDPFIYVCMCTISTMSEQYGYIKVKNNHRSEFSNLSKWKEEALIFFRLLLSMQLLKFKNSLRWSFFTFIYHRSSNLNYFIYTLHQYGYNTRNDYMSEVSRLRTEWGRAYYKAITDWASRPSELKRILWNSFNLINLSQ